MIENTDVLYVRDAYAMDASPRMSVNSGVVAVVSGTDDGAWRLPRALSVCARQFSGRMPTIVELPLCREICDNAFGRCTVLASVTAPRCLTVGASAFAGCMTLRYVSVPSCAKVGDGAFLQCVSLSEVHLPSVEDIGVGAFSGCASLMRVTMPRIASVPNLGSGAFADTPIGGMSACTRSYGSVYVPARLYSDFVVAQGWSSISSRIASL